MPPLTLRRREIYHKSLARVLFQYPVMTIRVVTLIHWQALRLWIKGAAFYAHPNKRNGKQGGPPVKKTLRRGYGPPKGEI